MPTKRKNLFLNSVLVIGSVLFALVVAELVVRDYKSGFKNQIFSEGGNLVEHHFRGLYSYDVNLGWVPMSNAAKEKWNTTVHTLADGIRSNGIPEPEGKRPLILAVGDSFTFGDQVADDQTWPALLEKITGARVLNGGVSSYGFDQTVLRAEQLTAKYKPDVLVVSLVYDDLDRCKQSVRHGVPKPYFLLENKALSLKNTPVPFKANVRLGLFRGIFGYSHLAHKIMARVAPRYWWQDTMKDERYVKSDVLRVVQALLTRLAALTNNHIRVIILFQDDVNVSETRAIVFNLIEQYMKTKLPTLEICDMVPRLLNLKKKNAEAFSQFFVQETTSGRHMSIQGNALIAMNVREKISLQH